MSFRCKNCNKVSQPYEKQHSMIVEKRDRIYRYYIVEVRIPYGKTKQIYTEIKPDEKDRNKKVERTFTARGWEIGKEIKVCKKCANEKRT